MKEEKVNTEDPVSRAGSWPTASDPRRLTVDLDRGSLTLCHSQAGTTAGSTVIVRLVLGVEEEDSSLSRAKYSC